MNAKIKNCPGWVYRALLIIAAAIWGLGTVAAKDTVGSFPPGWLVGIRLVSAGVILSLVLLPRMIRVFSLDHLKVGALLGVFVGLSYLCNTIGLTDTTATNSSFLTATYCVLVPFFCLDYYAETPDGL